MSNMFSKSFSIQTRVWPLVILRVGIGYWFWYFGYRKYTGMLDSNKLLSQLTNLAKDIPPGWYQSLAANYIAPHAAFFAYLVMFGEIAVAIGLILGFMTRPALLGGIFMNLNYQLSSGFKPGASSFVNLIFILVEISLLFTVVGRSFGLDYYLNKKYPRIKFLF